MTTRLAVLDVLELVPTCCYVCGLETVEGVAYPNGFFWRHWRCRPADTKRQGSARGRSA